MHCCVLPWSELPSIRWFRLSIVFPAVLQMLYPTKPTILMAVIGITGADTEPSRRIPGDKFWRIYELPVISEFIFNYPPSALRLLSNGVPDVATSVLPVLRFPLM